MRLKWVVALVLAIGPVLLCQTPAQRRSEEEKIIKTTYAKLAYADEVRIILDELQRTGRDQLWTTRANVADQDLNARLNFMLREFHFGSIASIAKRKISDFDGSPTQIGGQVLDVTPSVFNYSVDKHPSKYVAYIKFAWKQSPYQALWPASSWSIEKALQAEQFEGKKYTDYATYTVTVTLKDKSRTYQAWALFGKDDKSKLYVYFTDAVADPTALLFAYEHSLYPSAFATTDLRSVPFIDKWLHDNARSCHASSENKEDQADICCDSESGRCGVAKSSLSMHSRRLSYGPPRILPASFHIITVPVRPVVQSAPTTGCAKFTVNTTFPHGLGDTQEHEPDGGQHNFSGTVVGSCTYTDGAVSPGPCNVQCSAQSSALMNEFGNLTGLAFVHATAKSDSSGGDFTNGGTAPISCLGVSAGTVKSCTFPCSTTITITAGGKGNVGATINFRQLLCGMIQTKVR